MALNRKRAATIRNILNVSLFEQINLKTHGERKKKEMFPHYRVTTNNHTN